VIERGVVLGVRPEWHKLQLASSKAQEGWALVIVLRILGRARCTSKGQPHLIGLANQDAHAPLVRSPGDVTPAFNQ
jgi:myo-inositol catabolism protein IolC